MFTKCASDTRTGANFDTYMVLQFKLRLTDILFKKCKLYTPFKLYEVV